MSVRTLYFLSNGSFSLDPGGDCPTVELSEAFSELRTRIPLTMHEPDSSLSGNTVLFTHVAK